MRKTECELNASFGLIRVFASATLQPENFMAEVEQVFRVAGCVRCSTRRGPR